MNNEMKYEIEAYLENTDNAFYALMSIPEIPQCNIKLVPQIDMRKMPELERLTVGSKEFNTYAQNTVFPLILKALYVEFNRKTRTINTTVLVNPLFDRVLFLEEIDQRKLDKIEEAIKKYENANDAKFEETVKFNLNLIGILKRRK